MLLMQELQHCMRRILLWISHYLIEYGRSVHEPEQYGVGASAMVDDYKLQVPLLLH